MPGIEQIRHWRWRYRRPLPGVSSIPGTTPSKTRVRSREAREPVVLAKDAEKYAPLESMALQRASRTGDHVRGEEDGRYVVGRVDDQVKIGGRRIELTWSPVR